MKQIMIIAFIFAFSQLSYAQVVEVDPIVETEPEIDLADRNQCLLAMVDFATMLSFIPESEAQGLIHGEDPAVFVDEVFGVLTSDINTFDNCTLASNANDPKCVNIIKDGLKIFSKYNLLDQMSSEPACAPYIP